MSQSAETLGPIGLDNSIAVPPADGNLSLLLESVKNVSYQQKEVVPPLPGQVQVNIRQTGICGSDVHYWQHGSIGDFVLKKPMILGHESAGIITAVGEGVTTHKVGDRVALEPGQPCAYCKYCKGGNYNHCQDLIFAATPPYDGTLTTYYCIHASFAHKIPDDMTLEEASLMEPLGVAVQSAIRQGKVQPFQSVVVFGAGPVGLLTAAVCRAMGAREVVVVDIIQSKLDFAKQFCATSTFKPSPPRDGEDKMAASERNAGQLILEMGEDVLAQGGVDLVLECTGAPPCIQMGVFLCKIRGRMVQVGMGPKDVLIPLWRINIREIEMTGSFRYVNCYPIAIDLVASKKIDVTKIVTHRYPFKDAMKAFDATLKGKGEDGRSTIKVQICQGEAK
ncbi:hypothetical protein CBS101457_001369 [Exobasidium rhododendri]|nr:hypothetical protein CBS101457_001369 [Exobasidium rhododendri]